MTTSMKTLMPEAADGVVKMRVIPFMLMMIATAWSRRYTMMRCFMRDALSFIYSHEAIIHLAHAGRR